MSRSKRSQFDLAIYEECKKLLQEKDEKIADVCARLLAGIKGKKGLKVLDVGSSEGLLLKKIIDRFDEVDDRPLRVDCVEPDTEALKRFVLANQQAGKKTTISLQPEDVESFARENPARRGSYDAIFCVHVLYHIERSSWHRVIRTLRELLHDDGVLVISLVSRSSEIYRTWESLETRVAELRVRRTFAHTGRFYFAEELEEELKTMKMEYTAVKVKAQIRVPPEIIEDCWRSFQAQRGADCIVTKFLAFMFRVRPVYLISVGAEKVQGMLTKLSRGHTIDTLDIIYLIH